jgi:hypothetical protein
MLDPDAVLRDRVAKALADSIELMKRHRSVLTLATLQDDLAAALATQEPPDATQALTEPHSDADRVNAYAELCEPTESWIASDGYRSVGFRSAEEIARDVVALADREQAPLLARIAELEGELAEIDERIQGARGIHRRNYVAERDLRAAEAKVAELEGQVDALEVLDRDHRDELAARFKLIAGLEGEVERLRGAMFFTITVDKAWAMSEDIGVSEDSLFARWLRAERALADERAKVAALAEEWDAHADAHEDTHPKEARLTRLSASELRATITGGVASLAKVKADVWDVAYGTGVADAWQSFDFDGGRTPAARANPYHAAMARLSEPEASETGGGA